MREPSDQNALYSWYFAALKHGAGSPQAQILLNEPQAGYFRMKIRDQWLPAYIAWEAPLDENGELAGDERLVCRVVTPAAEIERDPYDAWTWLAERPVPYEAFKQAYETGRWPDDAPGANFQYADTLEGLTDQIDAMLAHSAQFAEIDSQVKCDQAANLKDRLFEAMKAADAMREAEKRPHDAAARGVQLKFKPVIDRARDGVDWLRLKMKPWLDKAEKAAKAAAAEVAGEGAAAQIEVKARAGGMSGRRTSTRKEVIATIVDFEAALAFVKDQPEIREAVEKVVKRLAKAGASVPGVEVRTETKVI